ncbi:hypothetical protein B0H12DRAFT_548051 [Mycena haematopus]|nr:hypothetical protein B0H12DRAFT_548051 [Mycena haematopus]
MEAIVQSNLNYHPRATTSDPTSALILTVSLSTSLSASLFTYNGQAETTSIPLTLTLTNLVPYVPSEAADAANPASETGTNTAPKSSLPILPIAAGGGGLAVLIVAVALYLLCRRRRRKALRCGTTVKTHPDLDAELPRGEIPGSRTFSRLTYTAPYVVPQSTRTVSTAAPSTVSIGQQYRTVRTSPPGRHR